MNQKKLDKRQKGILMEKDNKKNIKLKEEKMKRKFNQKKKMK